MRHRRLTRLYAFQGNIPKFRPLAIVRQSYKRVTASVLALTMTVALTACDPNINVLKGAIGAFAPLISVLVAQGKITQAKADLYVRDANALVAQFDMLSIDWKAAKTRADKAAAIQRFVNAIVPVAADFTKVEQLATALAILNTTLAVIQAFYGGSGPSAMTAGTPIPKDEGALNDYVKQQSELLKQMLQPK